jgi:ketosteroid isomerase-like protein
MRRRTFIASSVSGMIAGTVAATVRWVPGASATQPGMADPALEALRAAKRLEASGDARRLMSVYHSDALLVEPSSLKPLTGRAMIVDNARRLASDRKLLYFYYRQPQVLAIGSAALVVSNYESGYSIGGKTVEDSGKSINVVLLGSNPPLIASEVVVPNIYAGSYGALGAALSRPRFGRYPLRALGRPPFRRPTTAGGGENDVLFNLVRRIDAAWVAGNADDLLKLANRSGVFLVGDYSPYYIAGMDEVKEHFADFYKDGKVNSLQELNPTVRIWGDVAAVAFDFDLDYVVGGQQRRSPGRAVYTFARRGTAGVPWAMAACAASHLVITDIGDPYPLPG